MRGIDTGVATNVGVCAPLDVKSLGSIMVMLTVVTMKYWMVSTFDRTWYVLSDVV